MTTGHLVADGDLSLLCDIYSDYLVYAGAHLISVAASEDLYIDNYSALSVRDLEGGVSYFSCFFAENGSEESLLRCEIRLALGSDLSDEDVAGSDLGADCDNAALIEILESIVTYARNISRDLLGSELCITAVALVFLNVDRCEHIVHSRRSFRRTASS